MSIINDWWGEANMECFKPESTSYNCSDKNALIVSIDKIEPINRTIEGYEEGCEKGRFLRICEGLIKGDCLPAIEVNLLEDSNGIYKYKLYHGYHRWFISTKAGLSAIPVIIKEVVQI